jgi:catechol 2,3-dioxygenase-like lactoylglutathione lyase family enzyme
MTVVASDILEICLYAEDLDAAERFYTDVMGLAVHSKQAGRHVFFCCGSRMFLVFNPNQTLKDAAHGAKGPGHVAFKMPASEIEGWRQHLKAKGVDIKQEVKWPNGGFSFYFFDPAGNNLELATGALWGIAE